MSTQKSIEVWTWAEADDRLREKIRNLYGTINIETYDPNDDEGLTAFSAEEIKRYHVSGDALLTYKTMYYDIDRDSYLQFVNPEFKNDEDARKYLGIPPKLWERAQHAYHFDVTSRRDGDSILVFEDDDGEEPWTPTEQAILDHAVEQFADLRDRVLSRIRHEYEYLASDKSLGETFEAKEYVFDANGRIT